MKIAMIGNNSGGMYRFRKELITAFEDRGNEVVVLTPFDEHVEELRACCSELIEITLSRRGTNPVQDAAFVKDMFRKLRQIRPDFVITYTIKPNIYAGYAARRLGISYASNITGLGSAFLGNGILRKVVVFLYRRSVPYAKTVFTENSSIRDVLIKEDIAEEEKICVLPGAGVNIDEFRYMEYPEENDSMRFLFIGRIMREKGVDELFSAMRRLNKSGTKCTLDILGFYDEDHSEKIKQFEAEGWLKFHGFKKDVRPYIRSADCFVLPSWHEGMANTNLEAAACGRPVITSDIPGCREAVINEKSGLLCRPKDEESLYNVMRQFIAMTDKERAEMGKCGRKYMEERFDKKKVIEMTLDRILK